MPHEQSHLPNWTGLLGWSTKFHDGTHPSQLGPMSGERREWLEKALSAAFGGEEDPNKVIKKAVTEISEGRISAGLDMLDYASDFPDCAENIDQLGALGPVVRLLGSEQPEVVRRALEILTMYLPNNPKVQLGAALRHDCLNSLKRAVAVFRHDAVIVHFSLSCIGSLIRNVVSLESSFIREGGVEYLCEVGSSNSDSKSVQKVAAILFSLLQRHDLSKQLGQVESLVMHIFESSLFQPDNIQFWEVISSLGVCLKGNDRINECLIKRRRWIQSLAAQEQGDFISELESLTDL